MKKKLSHLIAPTLVTLTLLASPAWAQDASPATSTAAVARATKHAQERDAFVEQQVHQLHDQLQITDQQSKQWDAFAQTMRDNARRHDDASLDRAHKVGSLDALESMKSYAALVQIDADNMQKLVSAFGDLYGVLSDDQKKSADLLFRHPRMSPHHDEESHHHHHHHHHHKHKSSAPAGASSAAPPPS